MSDHLAGRAGMNHERWRQIEAIFQQAADLEEPARVTYLEKACGDDTELRREVDSLLSAGADNAGHMESALDRAVQKQAVHLASEDSEAAVGERIGPYRVITVVGRGGMG